MTDRNDEIDDDLLTTREELHTVEEELRAQNDQLVAAHELILAERYRYQELFDEAPDGYLVSDPDGVIREANVAAAHLLNRPRQYLPGKPLRVFLDPEDRPSLDRLLSRVQAGGPVAGEELRLERIGSSPVPIAVQVNATRQTDTQAAMLRWVLHNLTERKAAEERAARADRLAAVGQTVAAIGHESRSVLQRIQACLRLMRLEVADRPEVLDLLDRSGQALDDLNRLFEDIRAGVTGPNLRLGSCDLRRAWRNAWEQTISRGSLATLDDSTTADNVCVADAFRIGQVFANLFENSLDAGATRVTLRVDDVELAGRPALRMAIRDNGSGLAPEQRSRLFEPFYTSRQAGTGLGLPVVRSIVEAHGGTATVTDDLKEGAEIVITIPRTPA
ncbi:MAG TPA: ATP-binding protein [Gemmataceae bacterium]|nr:ATP-binding protein [Gemmataceae bacterium]